jgi:hypothetical protein
MVIPIQHVQKPEFGWIDYNAGNPVAFQIHHILMEVAQIGEARQFIVIGKVQYSPTLLAYVQKGKQKDTEEDEQTYRNDTRYTKHQKVYLGQIVKEYQRADTLILDGNRKMECQVVCSFPRNPFVLGFGDGKANRIRIEYVSYQWEI